MKRSTGPLPSMNERNTTMVGDRIFQEETLVEVEEQGTSPLENGEVELRQSGNYQNC